MPLYGQQFPILAPANVSASLPVYSFAAETGLGFGRNGAGAIGFYYAGALRAQIIQGTLDLLQDTAMLRFGSGPDTILQRDGAANTLALRNSTNAQTFNVYGSYTDASNHEGLKLRATTSSVDILAFAAGTGGTRSLRFGINSNVQWLINTSGHWVTAADNTYNIGAANANRPAYIYAATLLDSGGAVHAYSNTAPPAGGSTNTGFRVSNTANFGVFFGSGAPTLSAAKGSLYLRSDGSGVADRMYVNTDGGTTWTAVATVA